MIKPNQIQNFPDHKVTLICTGAQGEGQAVLMRIANGEHKFVRLKKQDTVIFSSSVVPGNERTVQVLKDELYRQQVRVWHYKMMDIHAGGHGQQDELKEMMSIMKPKFFLPIHGQYSMLVNHAILAAESGIPEKNIAVVENGQVIDLTQNKIAIESKPVEASYIMVDGLGVGDVGNVVLRDRQVLAKDGMVVIIVTVDKDGKLVGAPDVISRGFMYVQGNDRLISDVRALVKRILEGYNCANADNWAPVRTRLRDDAGLLLFKKTEKRPMVLPVIIKV